MSKKTDGEILINTKIKTDEAKKELKNLQKDFKKTADEANQSTEEIKKTVEDLPEPYKKAYEKIEQLREDDSIDQKTTAATIAGVFKGLGQSNSDAMRNAWDIIKADSEEGSQKVIDNLDAIAQEAQQTADAMSGVGSVQSAGGGSGSTISGMLAGIMGGISGALTQKALDLLKEAGQALVQFSKKAIKLASDLDETQNVVDVVFTTMSDDVNEFARNAINAAGMSETMAKKYVGTFGAMAKSFGFTEREAYDLATSLTQLTGDVASFYNLDHDEANTKLKAVFTGETEALKELGVVLTQTALDQFAMEKGFGKTTKEMTEQEKVALRYKFVVNQLTDASGDFIRTENQWANQTKKLGNQWDSYSASMGQGFIRLLKPGVEFLNEYVMPAAIEAADKFASFQFSADGVDILAASLQVLSNETGIIVPSAEALAVTLEEMDMLADEAGEEIAELTEQEKELKAAADDIAASVKTLENDYNTALDSARESLGSQIGLFDVLEEKSDMTAREIVDNWKKQQSAMNKYAFNMQKAISMGLDRALAQQLADGSEESMLILDELVNGTSASISEINREFRRLEASRSTVEEMMAKVEVNFDQRLDGIVRKAQKDFSEMSDIAGNEITEIQNYINSLTGKTVFVDIVGRTSSTTSFGGGYFDSGAWGKYTLDPENVPQLATGAVIPPNAPFTAVLGDQRNGYNLEGPEDMFRSIVREEIEAVNGNENETDDLLRELISVVSGLNIDGNTIFDIVVDRNQSAKRSYGYSPLTK